MKRITKLFVIILIMILSLLVVSGCKSRSHTITFESNDGSTVESVQVKNKSLIDMPEPPKREGYTFEDWYIDDALTTKFINDKAPTKDMTLYARWEIIIIDNTLVISANDIMLGQDLEVSVDTNTSNGTVTYLYKLSSANDDTYSATEPTEIGTYTVKATSAATSTYNAAIATDTFSITKMNNTLEISCDNILHGDTLNIIVTTNISSGTVTYLYKLMGTDDSSYTTTIPTAVGNYTVKATSATTSTYKEGTATDNFTIGKASNILQITANDIVYGDNLDIVVDTNLNGLAVSYLYKALGADDGSYTTTEPTQAGDYTVKATTEESVYYLLTSITDNFSIEKAENTLEISCDNILHGDTLNIIVTTNISSGTVTYLYKLMGTDDSSYTTTIPTAVGNYTVKATSASTSTYKEATSTDNFTIGKANNILQITANDIVYGDNLDIVVDKNLNGLAVSYLYKALGADDGSYTTTEPTQAGDYTVKATTEESVYYLLTSITDNFSINKAENVLEAVVNDIEYDDNIDDEIITNLSDGEVNYLFKAQGADDSEYTEDEPTEIGSYTVKIIVEETSNYLSTFITFDFNIIKAQNALSMAIYTSALGEDINLTLWDNPSGGELTYEYKVQGADDSTYTTVVPTEVGSYTLRVTSAETDNYYSGTFTGDFDMKIYARTGNYIYLGSYPQTLASDEAILGMGDVAGDDGYYTSSYDNSKYAMVVATPNAVGYKFSTGATVVEDEVYYFKVQPIKWRILEESDGTAFLLAELLLQNKRYDNVSNNWEDSEIRAWLNNEFYNKAFNQLQNSIIEISLVDNSIGTGYYDDPETHPFIVQNDTNDKVFMLSYDDCDEYSDYGVNSNIARRANTSDYSRAIGIGMSTQQSNYGNGYWRTRSPGGSTGFTSIIADTGILYSNGNTIGITSYGVRPAIKITL